MIVKLLIAPVERAAFDRLLRVDCVGARLIDRHRIERREHTDIRHYGDIDSETGGTKSYWYYSREMIYSYVS